jgi:deoxyribonuclease-4
MEPCIYMRIGFHVSIAGGFSKALARAKERECETVQIFTRSPRGWNFNELSPRETETFQPELRSSGISPLVVHLPYLPNLAASDPEHYQRSIESLREDLKRASRLGAAYLVMHPGRKGGLNDEEALKRVIQGIDQAIHKNNYDVVVLMENTAGQGSEICHRFSDLAKIVKQFKGKNRIGVCLDTAHAFAAGYDLSHKRGVDEAVEELDQLIDLDRLQLIHLNDSRLPFNSRVDRHEDIGKGFIGLQGFKAVLNHPLLSHLPVIMETPGMNLKHDLRNMKVVKKLFQEKE